MNQTNNETAYLLRIVGHAAEITSLLGSINILEVE
jgi:hypothetical protein